MLYFPINTLLSHPYPLSFIHLQFIFKVMVRFVTTKTEGELRQIIALQQRNLPEHLSEEDIRQEGFVTVRHDLDILRNMHEAYPHAIAKEGDKVIGYALVMTKAFRAHIPVLVPMFAQIDQIIHQGKPLKETLYFVMGQVCIDKDYRGKGIFQGMYHTLKEQMSTDFALVVTEVAQRNTRSLRAHEKVGFAILKEYIAEDGEDWVIIGWDWK